ncbi:MAG: hypothetical protein RTU92_03895 [Candidatus Thorarchaeota archaeon]
MGIAKKIGIVFLLYFILGTIWSILIWQGMLPMDAGGLEGPANILYIVFGPVTMIIFMILGSAGLM